MFRIDSEDAVAVLPSPAAAGPISGYFDPGDPDIAQEATVVSYDWMNALQETVIHPIEEAGLALSKAAPYDLLTQAMKLLAAVPVGSIIPWYDFNGALSFDTNLYRYCDGSTATLAGIGSQTLPDLSNRYLVGFGTEGGGDMDTAAWDTAAVGLANHEANILHTHSFTHTHEHDHTHGSGGYYAAIGAETGGTNRITLLRSAETFTGTDRWATGGIGMDGTNSASDYAVDVVGSSASPSDATTDSQSTSTTGNGLSATQSIQPRSIRVRFLMRIA